MRLHPGCSEALHTAITSGIPTHVCSVGWSSTLIAATLEQHVRGEQPAVHANEVQVDDDGTGTGQIARYQLLLVISNTAITDYLHRRVEGGPDKAAVLERLRTETPAGPLVYIGDSPTDIPPLLAADVGVVFGEQPTLRHVLSLAGVCVRPLASIAEGMPTHASENSPILYCTNSWHEIVTVLRL